MIFGLPSETTLAELDLLDGQPILRFSNGQKVNTRNRLSPLPLL